jgi:hypothetical protein
MNPTGNIDVSAGTPTIIFYNASPSFTNLNAGSNFYAYFSNVPAVVPLGGSTWSHFANGTAPNAYNGFSKFGGLTVPLAIVDIATGTTTNAPLKLTSGTLTTGINIRPGQVEFLNDEYFITGTTLSTRKVINDLVRFNTSGNITLDGSNEFVVFTAGTNNATLPTAVGFNKPYTISNIGTGVITILTTGGQTINGLPSGSFSLIQFDTIFLRSDGTNWIKLN